MSRFFAVLSVGLLCAKAAVAAPQAMLTGVKGRVQIVRGGKVLPARDGSPLQTGDVVRVTQGGATVFSLSRAPQTVKAGQQVKVGAGGAASSPSLWRNVYGGLSKGLSRRYEKAPAATRRGQVRLLSPLGLISETRPVFAWSLPADEATELDGYEISFGETAQPQNAFIAPTSQWTLPPAINLTPGRSYTWRVTPRMRNAQVELQSGQARAGTFQVATVQAAREAQAESAQLERELAGVPLSTRRLAQAAALAQRGFKGAAIRLLAGQVASQISAYTDDATLARLLPRSDESSRALLHALLADLEMPAAPPVPIVGSGAPVAVLPQEKLDTILAALTPKALTVASASGTDQDLMDDMKVVLSEMSLATQAQTQSLEVKSSAVTNAATPELARALFDTSEAERLAAKTGTPQRADTARQSAAVAARLGWLAYDAKRFDEAATWFERRAALKKDAYQSDRDYFEAKIAATEPRLASLLGVEATAGMEFSVRVATMGQINLQAMRGTVLKDRARTANNAADMLRYSVLVLHYRVQALEYLQAHAASSVVAASVVAGAPNPQVVAQAVQQKQILLASNAADTFGDAQAQAARTVIRPSGTTPSQALPTQGRTGTGRVKPPFVEASVTRADLDGARVDVATALEDVASSLGAMARFAPAEEAFQRSLAMRKALPLNTPGRDIDTTLRSMGFMYMQSGDLVRARDATQRALAEFIANKDVRAKQLQAQIAKLNNPQFTDLVQANEVMSLAVLLNNLGSISMSAGNYTLAEDYFNRALQAVEPLAKTGISGKVRDTMRSKTLGNMVVLRSDSGNTDEAIKLSREVVAMRRASGDDEDAAFALLNESGLLQAKGDTLGARNALVQARQIFVGAQQLVGLMAASLFLARLEREGGNLPEAERLGRETLALARRSGTRENIAWSARVLADVALQRKNPQAALVFAQEAESLMSVIASPFNSATTLDLKGRVLEASDDLPGALQQYQAAIELIEGVRATVASQGAFSDLQENSKIYEHAVRVLLKLGRGADALDYLNRARSKNLQDSLKLSNLKNPDRALQVLLDLAGSLEGRLGATRLALQTERDKPAPDAARVKNLQLVAASTQQEFFQVTARLRTQHPGYEKVLGVRPMQLKQAQKSIPADTVLIQYAPIDEQLYIFVVTRDSLKILTPPVQPAQMFARIREFRHLMDDAEARQLRGETVAIKDWNANDLPTSTLRDNLTGLYEMLLSPIEAEIKDKATVAFVPSGPLFYLPIHALAKRTPEGLHFFIEDKRVTYLTGADVLAVAQGRDETNHRGLLAIGDPSGAQLPNALVEVQNIARVYPDSRVLSGTAATKTAFLQPDNLERGILHLATHSILNPAAPDQSYIQLAPEKSPSDARLSIGEIYGLNLQGVDLVTLSACQTALGEREPDGGEITSMAEAFAGAGAPSVIASLWSVSDDSTSATMSAFYTSLASGKSKAEALQSAQIATLRNPKWNHPFHWAPFILMGDWR